jgi:methyl-accepting chemotaxis protein
MRGFSLRLTHKITAIGVIGVIGVVLVGSLHLYGESAVAVNRAAAENARAISELNRKVEIELLESRRAEKNFLLRNDAENSADLHIEIGNSLAADLHTMHEKIAALGKSDMARRIEVMSASLKQYQAHFASVVQQNRKLGLDETSGLENQLRASVRELEAKIAELREPTLLTGLLAMRRHENDFMLQRDRKYGDEMKKSASEFAAGLEKADIPAIAKTNLRQKLADYQRDFFAWMDTALTSADATDAMVKAAETVEPIIDEISRGVGKIRLDAERSNVAERNMIQWQMETR